MSTILKIYRIAVFLICFQFLTTSIFAQQKCLHKIDSISNMEVYTSVESVPVYVGGLPALMRFLVKEYKVTGSEISREEPFQSNFNMEFIITKHGELKAARITGKAIASYSASEIKMINIFNKMSDWIPGKCNNSNVDCLYQMPITVEQAEQ
jgi:protein TonB